MTEGEYKFDNSPLQVAYTNFAPDAETNVEGVNEVVYKVNWMPKPTVRNQIIFSFQRKLGEELLRKQSLVLSAFDVSSPLIRKILSLQKRRKKETTLSSNLWLCLVPGVRRMSKAQKDPENNINTFLNEGHIERMEQYVEANLGIGVRCIIYNIYYIDYIACNSLLKATI